MHGVTLIDVSIFLLPWHQLQHFSSFCRYPYSLTDCHLLIYMCGCITFWGDKHLLSLQRFHPKSIAHKMPLCDKCFKGNCRPPILRAFCTQCSDLTQYTVSKCMPKNNSCLPLSPLIRLSNKEKLRLSHIP